MTSEPAAAVIVAHGVSVNQGTLDLVGAGASVTAPGGSRVAGFIHRDGTAVQFVGDGGGIFLSAALANREFGVLMPAARQLLHAGPAVTAHPAAAAHTIHRRADSSASVGSTTAVDTALKSSVAQPLPERNRSRLESSFGASLSGVRVHTDAAADRAAASVQAKAFTTGQDVYFRSGQYQPGSKAGDHLLAHEVAHTVQQGSGSGGISRMPEAGDWHISQPNDSHEREAERAADAAIGGNRAVLSSLSKASVAPTVARRVESSGPAPVASTAPSSSLAASVPAKSSKGPHTAPATADAGAPPPVVAKDSHQKAHGAAEPPAGKKTGEATHGKSGPGRTDPDKKEKGPKAKSEHAKKGAHGKGEHPDKGKGAPHKPEHAQGAAKGGKAAVGKHGGGKADVGGASKGKEGAGQAHGGSGAGLASVVAQVSAAGHEQKSHASVGEAAGQAQSAADLTPEEAAGKAQGDQVEQMAGQKKGPFNRETFKKALRDKIKALQADDAKGIKDGDQAQGINGAVKAGVDNEKETAAGPINQVAQQPPSKGEPKPGEKLPGAAAAPAPQVDGSKAVPEPVPEERRSLAAESQAADQQMAAANVTPEQLKKSNEPAFTAAATAHETAKTQAEVLPAKAQNAEAKVLNNSRAQAAQTASAGLTEMQGQRNDKLTGSKEQQEAGKAKYEAARKRISEQLGGIYEDTKKAVDARMKTLDIDVNLVFEAGADLAKLKFYAFLTEELLAHYLSGEGIVDTFTGGNSKEVIFQKGRDAYLADMDKVIDAVADVVEKGLNEVVDIIEKGRVQLEAAMKQFGPEDAAVAEEVGAGLRDKFASLEKSVEEKQSAIIDSVAQKYVEAQKDVDSVINVLRDPVGALISVAADAVMGVIDTILKMKGLLMSALSKAGEAIDLILADPIAFLGYLVEGVKQGVMGFLSNIGTYLQKGLLDWLFGALAEAGIQMPEKFDLSGLMSIALQVLGLTWTNIRKRAVGIVGENVVKTLETGSEIIIMLATKGVTGIWDYIKEQATTLLQTLKDGVKSFIMESVIIAGAKWLIGLLNPASAFIKACMAIYDIVTFIINKGQQILTFVNAVIDSVLTIAKGNIAPAAKAVEAALARSIPVAIGFLASLLGIGDLGEKIKKVIDTIQAPINKVIDWLIKKAVQLVKAFGKMFGGKDKKDDKDPEHEKKVTEGLVALEQESAKYRKDGKITEMDAKRAAGVVKKTHPVFKSIVVIEHEGHWKYSYKASPEEEVEAGGQADGNESAKVLATAVEAAENIIVGSNNGKKAVESGYEAEKTRREERAADASATLLPTKSQGSGRGAGFDLAVLTTEDDADVLEIEEVKAGKSPRTIKTRSGTTGKGRKRVAPVGKVVRDIRPDEGKAADLILADDKVAKDVATGKTVLRQPQKGRLVQNQVSAISENLAANIEKMFQHMRDAVESKTLDEETLRRVQNILAGKGGVLRIVIKISDAATISKKEAEVGIKLVTIALEELMKSIADVQTKLLVEIKGGKK